MKYVIFGAGSLGEQALNFLGYLRVFCFVDNYVYGKELSGKRIICFEELKEMNLEDVIVVVASGNYSKEIEEQLLANRIIKYFVFHDYDVRIDIEVLPIYALNKRIERVSYNRILSCNNIAKYNRIAVLGINHYIPYLLSEIAIQNQYRNIVEIISMTNTDIRQCMGVPVVTWEEADKDFDCLVINEKRHLIDNLEKYENAGGNFDIIDIYDADLVEPSFYYPELKRYKDMCKGKRIFVIGNGPSLTIEDLNTLHMHQEICIASNMLHRAYAQTDFRADFYVMSDQDAIEMSRESLKNIPGHLLIGDGYHLERPDYVVEGVQYYHDRWLAYFPNYPKFSEDFSEGLYRGGTIIYSDLQLAAYLGAKEIYLLGIDHSYSKNIDDQGNHFIKGYYSEEEQKALKGRYHSALYEIDNASKAFETAERYSRTHGFRIYNGTRGGKLEIFERVDFDSLFNN